MDFYQLIGKAPWGDYGQILIHGMSERLAPPAELAAIEQRGLPMYHLTLRVARTGPYVPSISQPDRSCLVVTASARNDLEAKYPETFRFKPVELGHVVWKEWHKWDLTATKPAEFPHEHEPENYILDEEYSRDAASRVPTLWEIVLPEGAFFETRRNEEEPGQAYTGWTTWICKDSVQTHDLFFARRKSHGAHCIVVATKNGWKQLECIEAGKWMDAVEIDVGAC
jgi:hypothetical protein